MNVRQLQFAITNGDFSVQNFSHQSVIVIGHHIVRLLIDALTCWCFSTCSDLTHLEITKWYAYSFFQVKSPGVSMR